jgi:hypothetical protein
MSGAGAVAYESQDGEAPDVFQKAEKKTRAVTAWRGKPSM